MRRRSIRQALAALGLLFLAGTARGEGAGDLHFGEVLFHAHQERYFDALETLDAELQQHHRLDEPELGTLYALIDQAEFSVGDFELRYRMHLRAGRQIRAVVDSDLDATIRNDAAFRLARLHFQKDQPRDALLALEEVRGDVPEPLGEELEFLRANVHMALGEAAAAVDALEPLEGSERLAGFVEYNLGIALLEEARTEDALEWLDRAGRIAAAEPDELAIRDRANLLLGTLLFESADYVAAQAVLDRVRLDGPYSNHALLRAGWADASAERFERALVPWKLLAARNSTDGAVQEAKLALPYAYSKLAVHGRAAVLYGEAVESFSGEIEKLDASIASVEEGAFLEALVREEIRHDKDWVIHLRRLPDAPETFYLMALMASHDFQTSLQNYLDLEDLRGRLDEWQRSLGAFDDLVARREGYFEPRLPEVDERFRQLDARMRLRLEQHDALESRLQGLLIAPRPDDLISAEEREVALALGAQETALDLAEVPLDDPLRDRVRRIRGVMRWRIDTEYPARLTRAHDHLHELGAELAVLAQRYDSFVRTRQSAVHGYRGQADRITRLRQRVVESLERLDRLQARQGRVLEQVAIRELEHRRGRLVGYQNQALFAFADSYDRAAKAQVR